jgi:hypothetical protein
LRSFLLDSTLSPRPGKLALGAAILVLALVSWAPDGARAAELPPELAGLEQQMAQLKPSSERFTFQEELSSGEFLGSQLPFSLILDGRGEVSDAPAEASFEVGILGSVIARKRTIGDTEWVYQQLARELDRGHPWVQRKRKRSEAKPVSGLDPGGVIEADTSGQEGTFSRLVEELNGAQTLVDSGPVTVEDQRVSEFEASLNPAPVVAELEEQARAREPERQPLDALFPELPGGSSSSPKSYPPPTLELEAFIAPDGLPVRIRVTLTYAGTTVAARADILAIDVPVDVTPPPAGETISQQRLDELERRRAERVAKRELRVCSRLAAKPRKRCRAAAKRTASAPSSESGVLSAA